MLKLIMGWVAETGKGIGLLWEVLDSMGRPALVIDDNLKIVDCNDSIVPYLIYSKEELINESVLKIAEIPGIQQDMLMGKKRISLEGRCTRKDGESFPAAMTIIRQSGFSVVVMGDTGDFDNVRLRALHRARELSMYNALSETLSKHLDLKEMLKEVLETLMKGMRIDAAWLYIMDEESGKLSLWNFKGVDEHIFEAARSLEPYECFIGKVLSSEKALLVRNAQGDPRVTHINIVEPGFQSLAGIPLTVTSIEEQKMKVVGVLGVASRSADRFTSLDMKFLGTVGNQLGVAIENYRLIAGLGDKMKQIELINEISSVVNSSLSIGHIFRLVASEIKKTISFDRASINLIDEDNSVLKIFALDTKRPTKLTKGVTAPVEGTSAGWVATSQRPWINYDLESEMSFELDSVLLKEGIRSTISIPLFKDRPLGALNFDSIIPETYSDKDLEILLPIAKHLSMALENALLFEEISKEKREWERTFDAITDMVWIENLKGKVLRVNKAIIEKSGRPELALVHKSSSDMFKALRIKHRKEPVAGLPEGKRKFYKELTGLEGSAYHFWTYPLIDSDGKTYGIVNYLREVTEQRRLEQQLLRADKLASLGTLVAGIAHEVNNPLGIIAGYAEALLDRAKDPSLSKVHEFEDFPEYLETINREIFRCKNILKTLLDFARPSTGTHREIDINELIKEVILLVDHSVKKQQHIIELNLNRDTPKLIADPGALRQLFINIIMNSLYFMDTEGKIVISTDHITRPAGKGHILIKLADNGKGIDESMIDKIFDPFVTSKPFGEGTGLGLSICHRIVSEHNGTIDVENNKQGGTTFYIKLPVMDRQKG